MIPQEKINLTLTGALLVLFIFCATASPAQNVMLKGGVSLTSPLGNKMRAKSGQGTDLSYMVRTGKNHFIGLSMDYYWCNGDSKPIHIVNNLEEAEEIYSRMNMFSIAMINYIDLSPESRTKFFAGSRVGYRSINFNTFHYGQALIFFPDEEKIDTKKSSGLLAEFSLGVYIPFSKKEVSPVGLELKSSFVTGSKVAYIDSGKVTFDDVNQRFRIPAEQKAAFNYLLSTISLVWNLK